MLPLLLLLGAIALPPKPAHYVTDRAGVLPNAAALDARLHQFEEDTSDQILVYVDQHLPPETTIEEMGSEAIRQWGVGQKGKDNGVILFVFVADKKMRIEVGYGLEGALTDARSKQITSTIIKPAFQKGDYAGGITNGVDAILASIKGEPYKGTGSAARAQSNTISAVTCGTLMIVGIIVFVIIMVTIGKRLGRATPAGSGTGTGWTSSDTSSSSSSSSSDSFSSSDSSSSSDFSGGGGDGGGGGSSDSW